MIIISLTHSHRVGKNKFTGVMYYREEYLTRYGRSSIIGTGGKGMDEEYNFSWVSNIALILAILFVTMSVVWFFSLLVWIGICYYAWGSIELVPGWFWVVKAITIFIVACLIMKSMVNEGER